MPCAYLNKNEETKRSQPAVSFPGCATAAAAAE